jgi:predicted GIY-YIG superfamily endonuclease
MSILVKIVLEMQVKEYKVHISNEQNWFVYILRLSNRRIYIGCTSDMKDRMNRHQNGQVNSTKLNMSAELIFYAALKNKYKAFEFEKYLKSGSGRAFVSKHLI